MFCFFGAALVGVLAIGLGTAEDQIGPFALRVTTAPAGQGRTVVDLGALKDALDRAASPLSRLGLDDVVSVPDGRTVAARTHASPLLLHLTITRVDTSRISEILPRGASSVADVLAPLKTRLSAAMARLAARTVALGAAGGLILALLLRGRFLGALAGLAGGAGAPTAIFALTAATFDVGAFREPLAAARALLTL